MKDILESIIIVLLGLALFVLRVTICMWLWNWIIVELFDTKPISFAVANGIVLILSFIGRFLRNRIIKNR